VAADRLQLSHGVAYFCWAAVIIAAGAKCRSLRWSAGAARRRVALAGALRSRTSAAAHLR